MKMQLVLISILLTAQAIGETRNCTVRDSNGNETTQAVETTSPCPSSSSQSQNNQQQGQQNGNSYGANCLKTLKEARAQWLLAFTNYTSSTGTAEEAATKANPSAPHPLKDALAAAYVKLDGERDCRAMEIMSKAAKHDDMSETDTSRTSDGRATCVEKGGYTADFESCKSTASAYNAIILLERAMIAEQNNRSQNNQQNLQAQVAAQTASGDGQNAAFDATISDVQFKKGIDEEKVAAYTAAVMFLSGKLLTWQKNSLDSLQKLCNGPTMPTAGLTFTASTNPDTEGTMSGPVMSAAKGEMTVELTKTTIGNQVGQLKNMLPFYDSCKTGVKDAKAGHETSIIANGSAKSVFALALTEFFQKAAAAKMAADRLKAIGSAVAAAKASTATGANGTAGLVDCRATPTAPSCIKIGDRVNATGISQGDFSVGDGMGNNSFDTGATTAGATGTEEAGTGPTANVGNMTSPYNDQAKAANKILNPANAASITPTGGSGGGGGGAGGGLGGGGVSLGNDLNGADKNGNKAKDIEANKLAGNYGSGGGKGFSALAATKEDNPFASLFDSKSQGGLEEDRSIASDTGAADSGIFQKISRRYNQVQSEKRIEAGGLE